VENRLSRSGSAPDGISRRAALARLGAIACGVAAAGCAPATIVGRALYPESVALDGDTVTRMLAGLVAVVIPEPAAAPAIVRRLADPVLRFADYRSALAADLMRRSLQRSGTDRFDRLSVAQRRVIVQDGIDGGAVSARLYVRVVFLARIVFFCGLWNERGACDFIGYEGAFVYPGAEALTWPEPERFLPAAITADGNPA